MKVRVVGDVCLAGEPGVAWRKRMDRLWDVLPIDRTSEDVLIANVENAFTASDHARPYKWANLRAPPEAAQALRGLDVAVLANNHVGDYGDAGAHDTLKTLSSLGIATAGYGADLEAAARPLILKKGGVKIAVLSQCCPTTNGENYATHTSEGVPLLSVKLLESRIKEARAEADALLVYFHWGCERVHEPVPDQIRLGRLAVEFGADAVVGCHAHVIQSYECYNRRWVFHGLGNFLFGPVSFQALSPEGTPITGRHEQLPSNRESLMVEFEFADAAPGERLPLRSVQALRFDDAFVPRPISRDALTFDLDAVNRQLGRYTALRSAELLDESEPMFRAEARNGILAYWYSRPPICEADCSITNEWMRRGRRKARRVAGRLVRMFHRD